MVDSETIEEKISEKKEKLDEKIDEGKEKLNEKIDEEKEKYDAKKEERKEKFEERKEKGKTIADNVISELYKNIDDFKESLKNVQKTADQKYNEYKSSTIQTIDTDFVETKDTYYVKAAVPGIPKEDVLVEAGDNDVRIEATFPEYISEFEEEESDLIASSLKKGKCVKTIRFENSIDLESVTAKFTNGIVVITLPKLIIPKTKINVE